MTIIILILSSSTYLSLPKNMDDQMSDFERMSDVVRVVVSLVVLSFVESYHDNDLFLRRRRV